MPESTAPVVFRRPTDAEKVRGPAIQSRNSVITPVIPDRPSHLLLSSNLSSLLTSVLFLLLISSNLSSLRTSLLFLFLFSSYFSSLRSPMTSFIRSPTVLQYITSWSRAPIVTVIGDQTQHNITRLYRHLLRSLARYSPTRREQQAFLRRE